MGACLYVCQFLYVKVYMGVGFYVCELVCV